MFVKRSALQEVPITDADFIAEMQKKLKKKEESGIKIAANYLNLLICLRFSAVNGCGSAHEYLSSFVTEGWDVQSIVLLPPFVGPRCYYEFGVPILSMEEMSESVPDLGGRLGKVRNHFGWA